MKSQYKLLVITAGFLIATSSFAQTAAAPAAAPATKATAAVTAPASMTKTTPASAVVTKKSAMPAVAAAGGGADKVWVNAKSKTYHCFGDKWYGKTKAGAYMTEADAKAKGNHGENGKSCVK